MDVRNNVYDFLCEEKRLCLSFECEDEEIDPCLKCPLCETVAYTDANGLPKERKKFLCNFLTDFDEDINKEDVEKLVDIVQEWSDNNPPKPPKTLADVFFEAFPNALKNKGVPMCCACEVGFVTECIHDCHDCWLQGEEKRCDV